MKKRIISSFVYFCLIMAISVNVFADPVMDEKKNLENQKNQYNEITNSMNSNQSSIDKLEQTVQMLDNDISVLTGKISETRTKIKAKEKDIKNSQKEIDKLINDIKDKQLLLDERVRVMYINGNNSYISFVLDSSSFSDLISRMDFVKKIVSFDKEAIEELNKSRKLVEEKKKTLEKEKTELVNIKADLEKDKAEIAAKKETQQKSLDSLETRQNELEENKAGYKEKIAASTKKIQELIIAQQKPKITPSRGGTVSLKSGLDIVSYADDFLGISYRWGANGPNTFDCSGFVTYVFDHFGINLRDYPGQRPTTYTQINHGTYIPRDQLQPGDVIFFGSSVSTVHHVAIYYGDGVYIHAPQTGDVVKFSVLSYRSDYLTAKRMY